MSKNFRSVTLEVQEDSFRRLIAEQIAKEYLTKYLAELNTIYPARAEASQM